MRHHLLSFVAVLPLALSGCVLDFDFDEWDTEPVGGALVVEDAFVEGDLGSVEGVSSEARVASAYESYGYVNIELRAQGRGWAVMHMLDLETEQLQAGDVYDSAAPGTPHVGVLGCSGPSDGQWDYDVSADRVVVEVFEGSEPDMLRVEYRAEYTSNGQVATGSFEVAQF